MEIIPFNPDVIIDSFFVCDEDKNGDPILYWYNKDQMYQIDWRKLHEIHRV